jgi:hypothetical protein
MAEFASRRSIRFFGGIPPEDRDASPTVSGRPARLAVVQFEEDSAFVPFEASLHDILCIEHERVVDRDSWALQRAGAVGGIAGALT